MNKKENHNRLETKASRTAFIGAIHRFMATKDKRIELGGPDKLAYIFIPSGTRFFLSFSLIRNVFHKKSHKRVPGSYEYLTARTRFFDEIFTEAAKERIPQIVLLGAGYDTRAVRFQHLTQESFIYELDVVTTQNEKKRLLKKNKVHLPENLIFVPINFDSDDLNKILKSHGYNPEKKTLFLWEGVTMYIQPEAVRETILFIRNHSGVGSMVVFDYFYNSVIEKTNTSFGAKELTALVSKWGEDFTFGIEEGKVDEFLHEYGFYLMKNYTPEEFEQKYLKMNNGNILGKIYGFAGHAIARLGND